MNGVSQINSPLKEMVRDAKNWEIERERKGSGRKTGVVKLDWRCGMLFSVSAGAPLKSSRAPQAQTASELTHSKLEA